MHNRFHLCSNMETLTYNEVKYKAVADIENVTMEKSNLMMRLQDLKE